MNYFNRSANDGKASVVTTSQGWGVSVPLRKTQMNHFSNSTAPSHQQYPNTARIKNNKKPMQQHVQS